MLIIKVKGGKSIDGALKQLKNKFNKTKMAKELRDRKYFEKKSVKRRAEIKKAIYVNKKFNTED